MRWTEPISYCEKVKQKNNLCLIEGLAGFSKRMILIPRAALHGGGMKFGSRHFSQNGFTLVALLLPGKSVIQDGAILGR